MIKTGTYYKFNSEEDYIDFLKTAEKEGFKWYGGQKPTDKECINYYNNKPCYFYIDVDKDHCLVYGNNNLIHFTAILWTRKIFTGIATTMIVCDDGTSYDRLKKEGDFEEMKIIINEPAVILIKNGKKYVSKAHDEEFDAEKGLLMCLAKANGVTHLDLKRMLKKATYQSKKLEHKA